MGKSDTHECPAEGCHEQIPYERMACQRHWFSLPYALRRDVGRAWRSGDIEAILHFREKVVQVLSHG